LPPARFDHPRFLGKPANRFEAAADRQIGERQDDEQQDRQDRQVFFLELGAQEERQIVPVAAARREQQPDRTARQVAHGLIPDPQLPLRCGEPNRPSRDRLGRDAAVNKELRAAQTVVGGNDRGRQVSVIRQEDFPDLVRLTLVRRVDAQIEPPAALEQQHGNGDQRRQGEDQQQPNDQSIGDRRVRHHPISRNR
jgi:hypothetical protein